MENPNQYEIECDKYFNENEKLVEKLRTEFESKNINQGLIQDIEVGAVNTIKEKIGTLNGYLPEETIKEIKLAAGRVRAYNCYSQAKQGKEYGQKIKEETYTDEINGLSAEGIPVDCLIESIKHAKKTKKSIDDLISEALNTELLG